MKINWYTFLEEEIESGLRYAISRVVFKHRENPNITEEELLVEAHNIVDAIMTQLSEKVIFNNETDFML